ncbi:ETC complex I subunit [Pseudahrensia aquimaris]|uniref:ETC complex I subunit n=1 Tax=Pseudahrensia aquimaris TaxID=744461 RepID=A0ABW3FAV7_9HYPH
MRARIFRPAKTAMQSGKGKTHYWVLEYEPQSRKTIEPLMGYTSSSDPLAQVRMKFDTKEDAIAYAERNNIEYTVREPKEPRRRAVSYSDNFRHDRKVPWTH